jgi:hypothetical protein
MGERRNRECKLTAIDQDGNRWTATINAHAMFTAIFQHNNLVVCGNIKGPPAVVFEYALRKLSPHMEKWDYEPYDDPKKFALIGQIQDRINEILERSFGSRADKKQP